ncbi:TetR/AcrR family transcriptional regulator [Flavobacteriales bacterium]|nr:TetR/AcrR family transcriptional regulator [Flavobacteriales bacterium]
MAQLTPHQIAAERSAQLLQQAMDVFFRLGIRSVNMAELASEMGVSKKTLYIHFNDKDDLIQRCMSAHCDQMEQVISEAENSEGNAIDSELAIIDFVHTVITRMHPSMLHDLRKYHPIAFDTINKREDEIILGTVERNIKRGQKEGLYRTDISAVLTARFLVAIGYEVKKCGERGTFQGQMTLSDLYVQSSLYHIRAISTEKGAKYLQIKLEKEKLFQ